MTDLDTLIRRIDQELAAEVGHQKAAWAEEVRTSRERGPRLQRYDAVAQHVIELLTPRLAAFIERFKDVVKAEPVVREHTRAMYCISCCSTASPTATKKTATGTTRAAPCMAARHPCIGPRIPGRSITTCGSAPATAGRVARSRG